MARFIRRRSCDTRRARPCKARQGDGRKGFLDKLLGRSKQIADKGLDVAESAVDRAGDVAENAMGNAEDKLGMHDHDHDHGPAPDARPGPTGRPRPTCAPAAGARSPAAAPMSPRIPSDGATTVRRLMVAIIIGLRCRRAPSSAAALWALAHGRARLERRLDGIETSTAG